MVLVYIRYIKTADLVVTVVNTLIGSHCTTQGLPRAAHTLAVPLYILGMWM